MGNIYKKLHIVILKYINKDKSSYSNLNNRFRFIYRIFYPRYYRIYEGNQALKPRI